MRMIPSIRQAFGRHGPRRWFSGLFTILFCLLNFFSITGLGFALPTSHAASPWSRTGFQYHNVVHTPEQKTVLHKVSTGVQHHLKTHIRHVELTAPDLGITDTASAAAYNTGATATYTLTVSNGASAGPVLASPITVTDTIAPGISNIVATTSPSGAWTFSITSNTVTATYAGSYPIQPGTTLPIITITGTVPNLPFLILLNTATVSTFEDSNSANDSSYTNSMIMPGPPPPPDFALTMTHTDLPCVLVGNAATFTLTATNGASAGSEATGPITITDTLPAGLSNITASGSGWTTSISGSTLTASYTVTSPIAASASLPVLTVGGAISNTAGASLANTATLSAPGDTNSANNTTNNTISVCEPDLAISVSYPGKGPFQVGQTFSFTIDVSNVSNNGAAVQPGKTITVTNQIPAGLANVTAVGTGWTTTTGNGALTITYTGTYPINAGTTLSDIVVSGQLTSAALNTLSNTATVNMVGDTNQENNSTSASFSVVKQSDLALTLTHVGTACNNTHTVSYSLGLSNLSSAGPVLAGPLTVQITPPANLINTAVAASTPKDWSLAQNGDQSWTATYTGNYPIAPAGTLSGWTITGDATSSPVILKATVTVSNDASTDNNTATDTITICAPNPTITETTVGSGPYEIGQNVSFTITVNNPTGSGPILSGPLTITDQVPVGLANPVLTGGGWTAVSPSISASGASTVSATYNGTFPIPAGTTLPPLTMTGQLTNAAGAILTNPVNVGAPGVSKSSNTTATQTVPVIVGPNLSLVITPQTTCGNINDQLSYTLAVSNAADAGIVPANTPVTLTLNLPPELSSVSTSAASGWQGLGSVSGSTTTLTYTSSNPIAPGDSLPVITLTGQFTTPTLTGVILTGAVSTAGDTDTSSEAGTGTIGVCRPDLVIAKTHLESGPFQIGDAVNFLLAVTNIGKGSVLPNEPIVVTDHIPSGFSSVQASGLDWYVTVLNNTVIAVYTGGYPVDPAISLPNIIVSGQLTSDSHPTLTNTATVTTPRDKNLSNNTSTERIIVQAAPDLRLHIASPNSCVNKDSKATFTFKVTNDANAGPISASNPITLTFRIPAGLEQMHFSGSAWQWHKNGSHITATYISALAIAPGQNLDSFSMTGKVTKSVGGVVGFSAVVHVDDDSHTSNNTSYGKLSVCKHSQTGNGGTSQSGGGSTNHGGGSNSGTSGGSYPGLPPTGSDPLAA